MAANKNKLMAFLGVLPMLALIGCGVLGFGKTNVNLQPSAKMNVDDNGNPLPTVVRIYQLKTKEKMEKADFISIWKNDKALLGDDLLEKKELVVYPNQKQELRLEKKDEANFIALVAIFRKPDEETHKWKQIFEMSYWEFGGQDVDLILEQDKFRIGVIE